jgi:probable O-glycosylation ligase (exosortase A-associated)
MRLLLLVLFIVISIPLVIRRPLLGLMIYFGMNVVRPEMLFWGGTRGSFVFSTFYALVIVACIINGFMAKAGNMLKREFLLMVWLFIAIVISIMFTQYQPFRQDYYAVEFLKNISMFAIIYLVVDYFDEIKRFQHALLGCFAFLGVWGIQQSFRGNERLEGLGGNSWSDSNGIAATFILFLPVALSGAFSNKKLIWKLAALGFAVVIAATIVCTKSRAGLLGIIVSLIMFFIYSRKSIKLGFLYLLLALLVLPFVSKEYIARMQTMDVSDTEDLDYSARGRLFLWKAGIMIFIDNPIVGTGFLTFPEAKFKYENRFSYLPDAFRASVFRRESKRVSHNTYVQVLSDCGLLGAIPFYLVIIGCIAYGFRARKLMTSSCPEYRNRVLLLCGISAGLAGYSVCIFTIDALLNSIFYVQIIFAAMAYRMLTCAIIGPAISNTSKEFPESIAALGAS